MSRLVAEGEVKVWRSGGNLAVNIPRHLFVVLAGLQKVEAVRRGFTAYLARWGDGCIRVAVAPRPPAWAEHRATVGFTPTFRIPSDLARDVGAMPGAARLRVYLEGGEVYGVICWEEGSGQG